MEAISHAGAAMGILAKDGGVFGVLVSLGGDVILTHLLWQWCWLLRNLVSGFFCFPKLELTFAVVTSKLLDPGKTSEKLYLIDNHIACVVSGITADANILVNSARVAAQRHLYSYNEPMPVEQLVSDFAVGSLSLFLLQLCRANRFAAYVTQSSSTLSLAVFVRLGIATLFLTFVWMEKTFSHDHSVFRSCMLVTMQALDSSCTNRTPVGTMVAGRQLPLAPTTKTLIQSSSKCTRWMILLGLPVLI